MELLDGEELVQFLWLEPSKNESEEIARNKGIYKGGGGYGGAGVSKQ